MAAAAAGKSRLGIPAGVGKDFVDATPASKRSAFAKVNARKRKRRQRSLSHRAFAGIQE
jgi:hypothetical protein